MSTINYTYNVIVDRFRQFAAGHFQLRRFTHGEISQADLEKEAEWPWLHVKPRAINYSPGTRSFSFEIFISDLPRDKEDKTGYQAESITDCSLIFQDLINEIYLGNMFGDQVVLSRPVNSEPFVEQYTHTLTGVTGTIELNLDYDWSACSIPASWNYNTPTDSPSDGWGALQFIESLDQNGVFVSLLNDEEAPGNSYYYGTNASGVKGWYAIVDNIGLTCETLPDCAVIISIEDDIAALQTDVALKANIADLGATAFSNSYNDLDDKPTIPAAQVNSDWNATSGVAEILNKPTIPTTLPPSGAAGGDLQGTYPNPTVHRVHGVDFQSGAPAVDDTWIYVSTPFGPQPFQWQHSKLKTSQVQNDSTVTGTNADDALEHLDSTKQATLVSGTNIKTVNSTSLLGSGNLAVGTFNLPALTSGSVLFSNGTTIAQDNANLFFDDTNNRLGIGTATPLAAIHNTGTSILSGGVAINSTNTATGFALFVNGVMRASSVTLSENLTMGENFAISNNGNQTIDIDANNNQTNAVFRVTNNGTANEIFRANEAGNFMIGTTTDAGFKLDVNGTARFQGQLNSQSIVPVADSTHNLGTALLRYNVVYLRSVNTNGNSLDLNAGNVNLNNEFGAIKARLIGATGNFLIGTSTDVASSILTIVSTTKGFLPPRMTNAQRLAIATPAVGLIVYCTDVVEGLYINKSTGWTFVI